MTLFELFAELRRRRVVLWNEGDRLRFRADPGALNSELMAELKRQKPAVMAFLEEARPNAARPNAARPNAAQTATESTTLNRPGSQQDHTLPLTPGQERLWFLCQLEPSNPAYHIPATLRLRGHLAILPLETVLNHMVRRHRVLRARFPMEGGRPLQRTDAGGVLRLPVVDCRAGAISAAAIQDLAETAARLPFDLAQGPLYRITILWLEQGSYLLLINFHHLIFDAWSQRVFMNELALLYEGLLHQRTTQLPPLPAPSADEAGRENHTIKTVQFWKNYLAGAPPLLELPFSKTRPARQSHAGALHSFRVPEPLRERLAQLARHNGCTLFTLLLTAFKLLLLHYCRRTDLVVGIPIANREREETQSVIGFLVNTLVVRSHLAGNPCFKSLLAKNNLMLGRVFDHRHLPFETLVDELKPQRLLSHSPLFQIMFIYRQPPFATARFPGLQSRALPLRKVAAKFDLTLYLVREEDPGLEGLFEYNTDLYDPEPIRLMADHLLILLERICEFERTPILNLCLLNTAQKRLLLEEWNQTQRPAPPWSSIPQWLAATARQVPDRVAIHGAFFMTYSLLEGLCSRWAHHLIERGVRPETPLGLCSRRDPEMVVAVLAILKAGGAYVPLDPGLPKKRISQILVETPTFLILTHNRWIDKFPSSQNFCFFSELPFSQRAAPRNRLSVYRDPQQLSHILHTSGSTGTPKGVALTHGGVINLLGWARTHFRLETLQKDGFSLAATTALGFDLSVFELLLPLAMGGTVLLVENALHLPQTAGACDWLNTVPSAAASLLDIAGFPPQAHRICLAGEPMPAQLVRRLFLQPRIRQVLNLYGPTEVTTYATCAELSSHTDDPVTIGRPLHNTRLYILNPALEPLPAGIPGEIHLAGAGLARGYFARPALTAAGFIPNPFAGEVASAGGPPGDRLYKTGDRARFLTNGELEFLGRFDFQVKLRGFRIEPGDIEQVLNRHKNIRQAVVLVRTDLMGEKRLTAFLACRHTTRFEEKELRAHVKACLPAYMVPDLFVPLTVLPLNANGKIDRDALMDHKPPTTESEARSHGEELDPMESMIATLWQQLGLTHPARDGNFFDQGGNSLLMVRLYHHLKQEWNTELTLIDLFQYPSIAALAEALRRERNEDRDPSGGNGESPGVSYPETKNDLSRNQRRASKRQGALAARGTTRRHRRKQND